MKYAKKFKLVPYSAETLASTQINAALTNSLKMPTIPEQKVKIYNTALTKLKELQDDNQIKPVLNTNYEIEQNDEDISKEISDLEIATLQNKAGENLKDYSKPDKLKKVLIKKKESFNNEKFFKLLTELIDNNNKSREKLDNLIQLKNTYSTPFSDWEIPNPVSELKSSFKNTLSSKKRLFHSPDKSSIKSNLETPQNIYKLGDFSDLSKNTQNQSQNKSAEKVIDQMFNYVAKNKDVQMKLNDIKTDPKYYQFFVPNKSNDISILDNNDEQTSELDNTPLIISPNRKRTRKPPNKFTTERNNSYLKKGKKKKRISNRRFIE